MLIRRLAAGDLPGMTIQPSQRIHLGRPAEFGDDYVASLMAEREAWAAVDDDRVIVCFGIVENFPGMQGVAWAVLSDRVGRHHHAMTRFARETIAKSPLRRIEAIVAAPDIEPVLARHPGLDPGEMLAAVMTRPTPEIRWAMMVGLRPAAVLRKFGAAAETCVLMERIAA